jgi:hypothetical protein
VFADADRLSIFWFCESTVKSTEVPEFHKPLFCINNLFGLGGWCGVSCSRAVSQNKLQVMLPIP